MEKAYSEELAQMEEALDRAYAKGFDKCLAAWKADKESQKKENTQNKYPTDAMIYHDGFRRGMATAWEVARMLRKPTADNGALDGEAKFKAFGTVSSDMILTTYTAEQAYEMIMNSGKRS